MNIYYCPVCRRRYFESELYDFKVSENIVGKEKREYCEYCLNKRKRYIKLQPLDRRFLEDSSEEEN